MTWYSWIAKWRKVVAHWSSPSLCRRPWVNREMLWRYRREQSTPRTGLTSVRTPGPWHRSTWVVTRRGSLVPRRQGSLPPRPPGSVPCPRVRPLDRRRALEPRASAKSVDCWRTPCHSCPGLLCLLSASPSRSPPSLHRWLTRRYIRRISTQRRNIGCFQRRLFVCVCLCVFVNMITSQRVNIGWLYLGVGVLYKNLNRVPLWGHSALGAHPQNVALGYNVKTISAGCLLKCCIVTSVSNVMPWLHVKYNYCKIILK